jgi:dTDP-4-amino-4,6-dideoxygalactose transaminase
MSLSKLPPAGDAVRLRIDPSANQRLLAQWQPYQPSFYASGTAALAAAVAAALAARPGRRRVLLPGYGCPALVSAVLHAGGQPVLIDLEQNRPWLSLAALEAQLDQDTAAVIAVNFLGIPERLAVLAARAQAAGALLIDDSAQAWPAASLSAQMADFVVLSFGRGKPVSLLGGGAVLWRDPDLAAALPQPAAAAASRWRVLAKATAYNCLRQPWLYWIPQRLPLGLGETRYEPLPSLAGLDRLRQQALGAAVERRSQRSNAVQRQLQAASASATGLIDLAVACGSPQYLLRYPLLAPSAGVRQRLLLALDRAGLGASAMYGRVLPEVAAIPAGLPHDGLAQARDFAARLLTLPLHSGVRPAHVQRMQAVLAAVLAAPKRSLRRTQVENPG